MITKDDLLLAMCELTATIPVGYEYNIYSISVLAKRLNISKHVARKYIKQLEAEGLVCKAYEGGCDEDGYPYCYHGWSITKIAADSDIFKKCYKAAEKKCVRFLQEYEPSGQEIRNEQY